MKTSIDSTRRRRTRAAGAVMGLALAVSTGAASAADAPHGQMAADLARSGCTGMTDKYQRHRDANVSTFDAPLRCVDRLRHNPSRSKEVIS